MQLAVQVTRYVKVNREAQERLRRAEAEGLCLACMKPLDKTRTIRKCHERCYRATMRAVDRGLWSIEERVGEGKLGPDDDGGRPPSNPVSIEAAQRQ